LAFDDEDIKELNLLYEQGIKNGLNPKSMQIIDNKEILKVNPYLNKKIIKALLVNTSKIIDAHQFGNFIFEEAKKLGLKYHLNFKVNDIKKEKNE
jgi:glycerol-3-phosphate dehydrogenase